jgi:hypothetical protein
VRARTVAVLVLASAALALAARAVLALPQGGHAAGTSLAARALVPADTRSERAAEAAFAAAQRPATNVAQVVRRRSEAEAALGRVWRSEGRHALRSRAETLSALLALEDARTDEANAREFQLEALAALRTAVRLDRANGAAAFDLELLLSSSQRSSGQYQRPGMSKPHAPKPTSGSTPAGTGY